MSTTERMLWNGGHGVFLLIVLAGIAFVSGDWAILLALGPAAYLLAVNANSSAHDPRVIVIGYVTALGAGWVAYTVIAQSVSPMAVEPMSESGLRMIGSALVGFAVTTGVFYLMNTQEPMAYVATFTAAIGGFPTVQSLVVAVIAVLLMAGIQSIRRRYDPEFAGSVVALNSQKIDW
ncbi:hypothetical protein [Halococcus salifodinae]|uniref:hypothetical protein n=1 Tax=Halococcus salifodinae TaxID=36738 RepID=UPI0012695A58|nr:hypothetical protein [Halococcus salifodinae]